MTVKVISQSRTDEISANFQANCQKIFYLLADKTRFHIFDLLLTGRHCNCEIARKLDLSLSLVSHHLKKLVESGLVSANRDEMDARWIYFSINYAAIANFRQALLDWTDPQRYQIRESICTNNSAKESSEK